MMNECFFYTLPDNAGHDDDKVDSLRTEDELNQPISFDVAFSTRREQLQAYLSEQEQL